jgi:hypothetical protein
VKISQAGAGLLIHHSVQRVEAGYGCPRSFRPALGQQRQGRLNLLGENLHIVQITQDILELFQPSDLTLCPRCAAEERLQQVSQPLGGDPRGVSLGSVLLACQSPESFPQRSGVASDQLAGHRPERTAVSSRARPDFGAESS